MAEEVPTRGSILGSKCIRWTKSGKKLNDKQPNTKHAYFWLTKQLK